ncbi:hypothetical protein TEA_006274 [Camellia sinensis var. sinensis]|uniref:Uncharacterized protein n=1 Tax=Camellia sinensis var. sinensis TaxID=542762 RepID=A0A4S4E2C3_CAMSN|nr:hypothetical protein TEA_006274 [Camellia sinensis var. sinensis]
MVSPELAGVLPEHVGVSPEFRRQRPPSLTATTIYGNDIEVLENTLQIFETYSISNAIVRHVAEHRIVPNEYQWNLHGRTPIEETEDDQLTLHNLSFNFTPLNDLEDAKEAKKKHNTTCITTKEDDFKQRNNPNGSQNRVQDSTKTAQNSNSTKQQPKQSSLEGPGHLGGRPMVVFFPRLPSFQLCFHRLSNQQYTQHPQQSTLITGTSPVIWVDIRADVPQEQSLALDIRLDDHSAATTLFQICLSSIKPIFNSFKI